MAEGSHGTPGVAVSGHGAAHGREGAFGAAAGSGDMEGLMAGTLVGLDDGVDREMFGTLAGAGGTAGGAMIGGGRKRARFHRNGHGPRMDGPDGVAGAGTGEMAGAGHPADGVNGAATAADRMGGAAHGEGAPTTGGRRRRPSKAHGGKGKGRKRNHRNRAVVRGVRKGRVVGSLSQDCPSGQG